MVDEERDFSYRVRDFIPIRGFFDYRERVRELCDSQETQALEIMESSARGVVLGFYNFFLVGGALLGVVAGIEKMISN